MELGEALLAVGAGERAASFELFSETLDPEWIVQALTATGSATIRRRKLPAEYVVWIVIGMGLLRDRSIQEVVRHLDLVLPTRGHRAPVSGSAIVQARERLGPEPLAALREVGPSLRGLLAAAAPQSELHDGRLNARSNARFAAVGWRPPEVSSCDSRSIPPLHCPSAPRSIPRQGLLPSSHLCFDSEPGVGLHSEAP